MMSIEINCYVEKKDEKTKKWIAVSKNCFCLDFKFYLPCNYMSELNEFHFMNVDELSPEIKKVFDNGDGTFCRPMLRCLTLTELKNYAQKTIDEYTNKTKSLFMALGVGDIYRRSEGEEFNSDSFGKFLFDDENGEGFDVKQNPYFNPLTFPINKDMIIDWNESEIKANSMREVIGICEAISANCYEENNFATDDEIRVIFVI